MWRWRERLQLQTKRDDQRCWRPELWRGIDRGWLSFLRRTLGRTRRFPTFVPRVLLGFVMKGVAVEPLPLFGVKKVVIDEKTFVVEEVLVLEYLSSQSSIIEFAFSLISRCFVRKRSPLRSFVFQRGSSGWLRSVCYPASSWLSSQSRIARSSEDGPWENISLSLEVWGRTGWWICCKAGEIDSEWNKSDHEICGDSKTLRQL